MNALQQNIEQLVTASKVLAHEGVIDILGHASVRHPDDPSQFLMSRSIDPELITTDDILPFGKNGEPVRPEDAAHDLFTERFIHAAIYEARPDIGAVIHSHSLDIIPYSVSQTPIRPMFVGGAKIGGPVPVWDIRTRFGDTNLLVTSFEQGRDLARSLGDARAVLMRGHGGVVAGEQLVGTALIAISLQANAALQSKAMAMGNVQYLSDGEIARGNERPARKSGRNKIWDYHCRRAGL